MTEWRDIPGYEGFYMVSDHGQIRGVKSGKVKVARHNIRGYLHVSLYRNCEHKGMGIHKAVALAFVPGYAPGLEVNHIDGDRLNNAITNLEWVTGTENIQHAREIGAVEYRPVLAIPVKPGVGFFFRSVNEATKHGFQSANIYNVLSGKKPTHKGYSWVRPDINAAMTQEPRPNGQ